MGFLWIQISNHQVWVFFLSWFVMVFIGNPVFKPGRESFRHCCLEVSMLKQFMVVHPIVNTVPYSRVTVTFLNVLQKISATPSIHDGLK